MPCYIVNFDDREALEVSIIENVQHESLNYIEEAKAFKRYVEERGYGAISELARKIGKSPSYVSRRISILELPKHLQEELLRCRKTSSIAQELISMDGDYTEEISRLILGTNITSSQVRKIIKKIKEKGAEYDEDTTLLFKSSLDDKRDRMVERVLTKCIASFRLCMMRFDEALDYLDKDEWVLWNELMQYRSFTHQQIDNLLRLERKMKKAHHFN
jgi:ParB family chromosome partitioning protein